MVPIDDYYYVCKIDELEEGKGERFYINDTDIAVFKYEDSIHVLSNVCPHQLASAIHEGFVEDGCVICPLHGWTFNLKDGSLHNGGRGLESYSVKIDDGKIYSKVYPKELNW